MEKLKNLKKNGIKMVTRYFIWCTILIFIGCSKSDDSQNQADQDPQGIIDSDLVGTWVGTVSGSFGDADMTMVLENNGDMSAEGSTSLYCPMEAKWKVLGGKFKASGNDKCDGTSVTFEAPYSKTKLNGKWSAGSGNSGTFTAEKQ